ncbi:MAG: acylneuraminate cytidylyltransferase [Spirochaetales bacterium]|nr:acylneuraminate cytidylyltransferase [Spirochaetales bacterium]
MGNTGYVKAVFLQARLDSSRLPRKVLLPLGGSTVIEQAMTALRQIDADIYALLTDPASSKELAPLAEECEFSLFTGDKENVLKRYCDAAVFFNAEHVIRATGDNPLVSAALAEEIYTMHLLERADYSGFQGIPVGAGVEVVSVDALLDAGNRATSAYDREHVCPYLYNNPERYRINRPYIDDRYNFPDVRITLDTKEDYRAVTGIFRHLYKGRPVHLIDVIDFLKTEKNITHSVPG